jgi:putative membrane protein
MNAVSQIFAVLAALIYIVVFPLESFLMHRPWAQKFLSTPPQNVPAVMMWAIPTGFRNLLIGLGALAGVVAVNMGHLVVGYTLVVYCCSNMVLSGATMGVADWLGHYPKKGDSIPGTLGATVPPLIALIALPF